MLTSWNPIRRAVMCPLFAAAVLAFLTPTGALAATGPMPCGPPAGPENLQPAPGVSDDTQPSFNWNSVPDAIWYQLWITRDGQTFKSVWRQHPGWSPNEPLPSGAYRWSVRAWSPCGISGWVSGGTYALQCAPLSKPSPWGPDGTTFTGDKNTINPNFSWDAGAYARWAQISINRNGQSFLNRWIDQGPWSSSRYISFGYGFFPDGTYSWIARDWSSCGGLSEWSDPLSFTVDDTPCSEPPPWITGTSGATEFDPLAGLPGSGSSARPTMSWSWRDNVVWYQVQVLQAGQVVHSDWVKRNTFWQADRDMPGGDLTIRVRGWNPCGFGPWSSPEESVTTTCQAGSEVTGLRDFYCLYGYGVLGLSFDILPGVSWYQVIMRKDGREIYNRWHDWTDPVRFADGQRAIEAPYGQGRVDISTRLPCTEGDYEAFVRGWSVPCGVSDWAGPIQLEQTCDTLPPLLLLPTGDLSDPTPAFTWAPSAGEDVYEMLLQRNGRTYYRNDVSPSWACGWTEQVQAASTFDPSSGVAQDWTSNDQSWQLDLPFYFPFCNSSYSECYVSDNGVITFDSPAIPSTESVDVFTNRVMIAALWDDLLIGGEPDYDIYVTEKGNSVTIRWQGTEYPTGLLVNFAVTLYRDGTVRCSYGSGNAQVGDSLIGISRGDGDYYLVSTESGTSQTDDADILFRPTRQWSPPWHLPLGDYQWWLRAYDECGGKSRWSSAGNFSIVPSL